MDTPKLRLKEKPSSNQQHSIDLSNTRFAKPKPPTIFDRLFWSIKKSLPIILVIAAIFGAFLFTPFQKWDDYENWDQLHKSLINLSEQPESYSKIQHVSALAHAKGILWGQPSGSRPEKWYQRFKVNQYDAEYGIVQMLALGLISHGHQTRGLKEIRNLEQRTKFNTRPALPQINQAIKMCEECKKGKVTTPCPDCKGSGLCSHCKGKGTVTTCFTKKQSFPSGKIGLSGTRRIKSIPMSPIKRTQQCPQCNGTKKCKKCGGTGKITATCPICGGKLATIIAPDKISGLFQNSIRNTASIIKEILAEKRVLHTAASLQQTILGKSKQLKKIPLLPEQQDSSPKATTANEQSSHSSQSNNAFPINTGETDKGIVFAKSNKNSHSQENSSEHQDISLSGCNDKECLGVACKHLQRTPLSKKDLKVVMGVVRNTTNSPSLRSAALSVVALSTLLQGNTNDFMRISKIQKKTFPNQPQLIKITSKDYTSICENCMGTGKKATPCPRCMAPTKCTYCNGTRRIKTNHGYIPCKKCCSLEVCKMCNGTKQVIVKCPKCKGTGHFFVLSDKVKANYNNVLSSTINMCESE